MIILFLIFLLQFALACVCLAMNDTQINNLIQGSWIKASSETKAMVQSKLQCCGFQSESTSEGLDHPSCGEVSFLKNVCEIIFHAMIAYHKYISLLC